MTFGPRHYVPVLKVKRAEKSALASISLALRPGIVPLLEIVKRTSKSVDDHLTTSFQELASSLIGYHRCMLDARELAPDGPTAAKAAFDRAIAHGIAFTPVTGISRIDDVSSAIALAQTHGIAIRLTEADFESHGLPADLTSFLLHHRILPSTVDLIVDLGDVGDLIPAGIMHKTRHFLTSVPTKGQWRTLTVTGSAFPLSMGVVDRNSMKRVLRAEWLAWRDGLYARRATLERLPTYSDCAIQHPEGIESFDPTYMRASPTIRYALDEDWLLVKGETSKSTRASEQFPILSMQVVYGPLQSDYRGPAHCAGCRMMQQSANGASGIGSPEVWRRIGTVHHVATVVHDGLGSLQWP